MSSTPEIHGCEPGDMAGEINRLNVENAALREQLTEARSWIDRKNAAIETWQQQAKELQSRLAQVTAERDELRLRLQRTSGEFLGA